jgi:hypothetical protein
MPKKKGKETTQQKNKNEKKVRYKAPKKSTPKKKLETDFMGGGLQTVYNKKRKFK